MTINCIQNPSFKAYIPVTYYAKNPVNDKYVRVIKPENVKKCQSFVVRNLNGTAKSMKNDEFVNFYSKYDRDYRNQKEVRSIYNYDSSTVIMVTGKDTEAVTNMAKPIGIAKGEAMDRTGHSGSFEAQLATRDYFSKIKSFLKYSCKQVKNDKGERLALRVYFDPKYKKDGTLKEFKFVNARMVSESEV